MRIKRYSAMKILTQDDVIFALKARQGPLTLRRFAKKLGISAANLSAVYKKKMLPGKRILKALELGKESTRSTIFFELNGKGR